MSLRSRIQAIERVLGVDREAKAFVVWTGSNDEECRDLVEEAHRNGWDLTVVEVAGMDVADTLEEAEALVEKHRREIGTSLTVYRRDTDPLDVLLEWKETREWMRGLRDVEAG